MRQPPRSMALAPHGIHTDAHSCSVLSIAPADAMQCLVLNFLRCQQATTTIQEAFGASCRKLATSEIRSKKIDVFPELLLTFKELIAQHGLRIHVCFHLTSTPGYSV